jgi:S-layer protein
VTGHSAAALTSLTLNGSVALTGTYAHNGAATVSAATDHQNISLTMTGGGVKTITLGNGANTVVTGAAADVITVGTGANTITPGAGADTIILGAGTAASSIVAAGGGTYQAATAATIVSGTTPLTGIDKVTGLQSGDTYSLAGILNTFTGAAGTTIAAATGTTVSLVRGSFATATNIWTTSATGTDTLFVYDIDGAGANTVVEAIALIGVVATGTAAAGVLTFA